MIRKLLCWLGCHDPVIVWSCVLPISRVTIWQCRHCRATRRVIE